MKHDELFRSLGATHVYDETFPRRGYGWKDNFYGMVDLQFARYYFNVQGTEIGYHLVCMEPYTEPHIHPTPRIWGMSHTLVPL